jgi:2-polyprenyl-6-methoxyphenol hydroxylase-like FAD-dependent oxidoreductase
MSDYDIAIIGNRVAAAAVLLTLCRQESKETAKDSIAQQSLRIVVIAPPPAATTGPLVGESLPPTVVPLLQELGVWHAFAALAYLPGFSRYTCWETAQFQPSHERRNPYGYGWIIDRRGFEQMLWAQLEEVDFERLEHTLQHTDKSPEGWQLQLSDDKVVSAAFVLDCSGRAGCFSRGQSRRDKASTMVAACDFLPPLKTDVERTAGVMIEAVENGWWYSSLLPNGRLAVAYFSERTLLRQDLCRDQGAWQQQLAQTEFTRLRIESGEFAHHCQPRLMDASMYCLQQSAANDWLACGDAAMALDPLSAHGMATALWSGHKAAQATVAALQGDRQPQQQYVDSIRQNWQLYCQQRRDIYQAQPRFVDSPFWQSNKGGESCV